MRKIALVLVVMGFSFTQVKAQSFVTKIAENLSGGFKTEANISNFSLLDMHNAKSKMNIGGTFGGFVRLEISEYFAVQEDVLFHYKTSTLEQRGIKSDFQYWGIEVPIYFIGQRKMNKGERFYIGFGSFFEYGLSAKYKTDGEENDLYKKDETTDKASMTRLTIGAASIIGYEFRSGIQVNAGYKLGLTNALDADKDDASMYLSAISLGFGYCF